MVAMAFLLKKPFKKVIFNSPVTLIHLHLHEICASASASAVQPAEFEESSSNGDSNFSFGAPSRLYSVSVCKDESGSVPPENVAATPITREQAITELLKIRLDLGLNSFNSSKRKIFFLESLAAADHGGDENHVDPPQIRANCIPVPDLNLPPLGMPVTEFVRDIEKENVSRFIEYVRWYLGEHIGGEAVAEYNNLITGTQVGKLDSIQIWTSLTTGGEFKKALVNQGVTKVPIRFGDLPSLQEQLPAPPPDYKAAADNHVIDYNDKSPCLPGNATLSDALNDAIRDGGQSSKAKRKTPYLYDFLETKKPRHGGALRIDAQKAPIYEAEDLPSSDSSD